MKINQTTDHIILFLDSVICSSLHLAVISFIQAITTINIAIANIADSINITIHQFIVSSNNHKSTKIFLLLLVNSLDQVQLIHQSISHLFPCNILKRVQGIFIKINQIRVYQSCFLAEPSCSSSLHIDITI
ncbi:hypothetical protein HOG21_08445 [bacterium]|nr:hypothetical protein [bacterium]